MSTVQKENMEQYLQKLHSKCLLFDMNFILLLCLFSKNIFSLFSSLSIAYVTKMNIPSLRYVGNALRREFSIIVICEITSKLLF